MTLNNFVDRLTTEAEIRDRMELGNAIATASNNATGTLPTLSQYYPTVTSGTAVPGTPSYYPSITGSVGSVVSSYVQDSPSTRFFNIQVMYVESECAITKKKLPIGSVAMILGSSIISKEAFEKFLLESLSGLLFRRSEIGNDTDYDS